MAIGEDLTVASEEGDRRDVANIEEFIADSLCDGGCCHLGNRGWGRKVGADGLHTLGDTKTASMQIELAKELGEGGCLVDISSSDGRWRKSADFDLVGVGSDSKVDKGGVGGLVVGGHGGVEQEGASVWSRRTNGNVGAMKQEKVGGDNNI